MSFHEVFTIDKIATIIAIVTSLALFAKWVRSHLSKDTENLEVKMLGKYKDGRKGDGGYLDSLRQEFKQDLEFAKKDFENKLVNYQKDILNAYKQNVLHLRYMREDFSKMEKSLEKITDGQYTRAKRMTEMEEENNHKRSNINDNINGF